MREFKVNEYITLKLEGDETIIYISGERFRQCKFLLLEIPVEKISSFDEIESIDEAAEKLDQSLDSIHGRVGKISPETEFWGHCSNLQVWAENEYDTRILHRNLAFPLIKKLTDVGDPLARKVFKEEIAKRFESGHLSVIQFLINESYLNYLNSDELNTLFTNLNDACINSLSRILENDASNYKFKQFILLKFNKPEQRNGFINNLSKMGISIKLNEIERIFEGSLKNYVKDNALTEIKFRGTIIPMIEAWTLLLIEFRIKKQFKSVHQFQFATSDKMDWENQFVVKNNRIHILSIYDWNDCELCHQEASRYFDRIPSEEECENCGLDKLPETIGHFTELVEFYLHLPSWQENCDFSTLPHSIVNLKSLHTLYIHYANFRKFPKALLYIPNLQILSLKLDEIHDLPDLIENLKTLRELDLENNKLKKLPATLGNFSNLQILNVKYNKLSEFPASLSKISSLKRIYINGNDINHIPPSLQHLIKK